MILLMSNSTDRRAIANDPAIVREIKRSLSKDMANEVIRSLSVIRQNRRRRPR